MEQILIIEDDTDINNLIREALEKAGYDCRQAFSGTEGASVFSNGALFFGAPRFDAAGNKRGRAA